MKITGTEKIVLSMIIIFIAVVCLLVYSLMNELKDCNPTVIIDTAGTATEYNVQCR